jgi:hypothetical protein
MTVVNRTTLKTYFETGDTPSEAQFVNLIDSLVALEEANDKTFTSSTTDDYVLCVSGTLNDPSGGELASGGGGAARRDGNIPNWNDRLSDNARR